MTVKLPNIYLELILINRVFLRLSMFVLQEFNQLLLGNTILLVTPFPQDVLCYFYSSHQFRNRKKMFIDSVPNKGIQLISEGDILKFPGNRWETWRKNCWQNLFLAKIKASGNVETSSSQWRVPFVLTLDRLTELNRTKFFSFTFLALCF